jgi:2-keto-3-deoxy-L-rhamnonate aldolase RhmA
LSQAGFDWLMIDMEHGPGDILMLIGQMQAMRGYGVIPLVRAPWNDFMEYGIRLKELLASF